MNLRKALVDSHTPIIEVIKIIDSEAQIAVVVKDGYVLGTVTDGDIRRGILRGVTLDSPVSEVMNKKPITMEAGSRREKILKVLRQKKLRHMVIVDKGKIAGIETLDELSIRGSPVVIMAGGLGTRLRPLTLECPKPLLKVGDKPLLEIILDTLEEQGFQNFYISVNYLADRIREYFGDRVNYLTETEKMGTAGSLSLLPDIGEPVMVINGDLLTRVNYSHLLDYHKDSGAQATMCVKEYQVPYGVVRTDNHRVTGFDEKPVMFINAGIYVLEPEAIKLVSGRMDMPELIKQVDAAVFPIREYWLDIGYPGDFEKASTDYEKVFIPNSGQGRI
jgi:dTDP-glucose pyrophosphorylase